MDEQVIDDLYNRAVSKGYKKSRQEFIGLLHSDGDVMNDMYSYVQSKGYKKSVDEFKNLIGATAPAFPELKKKEDTTALPSGLGSSVSSVSAEPERALPEQKMPEMAQFGYQPGKPLPEQIPSVKPDERKVELEANPIISFGKKFWETLSKQIPSAMEAKGAQTQSQFVESDMRRLKSISDIQDDELIEMPSLTDPRGGNLTSYKAGEYKKLLAEKIARGNKAMQASIELALKLNKDLSNSDVISSLTQVNDGYDLLNFISSSVGQTAAQVPLAIATGGGMSYAMESGNIYLETVKEIAEKEGITPVQVIQQGKDQVALAEIGGAISGALDLFGAKKILDAFGLDNIKKDLRRRALTILVNSQVEGATEVGQEFVSSAAKGLGVKGELRAPTLTQALDAYAAGMFGAAGVQAPSLLIGSKKDVSEEIVQPVILDYGDSKFGFIRDESGRMEMTKELDNEEQAISMSNMLSKAYKGLQFTIEEIQPTDPYKPTRYKIVANEIATQQEAGPTTPAQETSSYRVNGQNVEPEFIDYLMREYSKEEILAMNIEINNDNTGVSERLQEFIGTKPTQQDAVQKQAAGELPVQSEAGVSGEVAQGEPQAKPEGVTEEGKVQEEIPEVEAVETVDVSKGFTDYNPQDLKIGEEVYYSFDGKSYSKGKVVNRPSAAKQNVYTIENENGVPTVIIYGGERTNVTLKKPEVTAEAGVQEEVVTAPTAQAEPQQITVSSRTQKKIDKINEVRRKELEDFEGPLDQPYFIGDETGPTVEQFINNKYDEQVNELIAAEPTTQVELTDDQIVEYNPTEEVSDKNIEVLLKVFQSKKFEPTAEPIVTDLGDSVVFEYNNFDDTDENARSWFIFKKKKDGSITGNGVKVEKNRGNLRNTQFFRNYVNSKRAELAAQPEVTTKPTVSPAVSPTVAPAPEAATAVSPEPVAQPTLQPQAAPITITDIKVSFAPENAVEVQKGTREDTSGRKFTYTVAVTSQATDQNGTPIGLMTKRSNEDGILSFTLKNTSGQNINKGKAYPTERDARMALAEQVNRVRAKAAPVVAPAPVNKKASEILAKYEKGTEINLSELETVQPPSDSVVKTIFDEFKKAFNNITIVGKRATEGAAFYDTVKKRIELNKNSTHWNEVSSESLVSNLAHEFVHQKIDSSENKQKIENDLEKIKQDLIAESPTFENESDKKTFSFITSKTNSPQEILAYMVSNPELRKYLGKHEAKLNEISQQLFGIDVIQPQQIKQYEQVQSKRRGDGGVRNTGREIASLEGAPIIQGATGPDANLVKVAEQYAADNGIDLRRQAEYVQVDEERAKRIAEAYEQMANDPKNPKVKEAYAELIKQTKAQYQALIDAGYEFTFFDDKTDPYDGNPNNAMRDLRQNKKMAVYGTFAGYGTEGITDSQVDNNPLLVDTGLRWKDQNGEEQIVTANDLFRAVHDAFGHGLEGSGFRARGEENAWQAHVRLFTGPAIYAMTSETRGQNSWLNFGPFGETNRRATLEDTVFAEQKIGLMPEWTWTEGRAADMEVETKPAAKQTSDEVEQVLNSEESSPEIAERALAFFESIDKQIGDKLKKNANDALLAIPLTTLQAAVKAVKVLIKGGIAVRDAIRRVAADNNISQDKLKDLLNLIPIQEKFNTLMTKADELIARQKSRGIEEKRIVSNLDKMVRDFYKDMNVNDAQRKIMEREARARMGAEPRKAASIGRVLGVLKDIANVTREEKLNIIGRIRELGRDVAKDLTAEIRAMAKGGTITPNQSANIIARFGKVNMLNEKSVSNFVDYMAKVFADAEYASQLKSALSARKRLKSLSKNKDKAANLKTLASKFAEIDPTMVEDIYEYNKLAKMIEQSIEGSSIKGKDVKFANIVQEGDVMPYINKTLEAQRKKLFDEKLKEVQDILGEIKDILGIDAKDLSYEDLLVILSETTAKGKGKDNDKLVRDAINKAFDVYSSIIKTTIKTGVDPFTGQEVKYTDAQKKIISDFMDMDLNIIPTKQALEAVDAALNFLQNKSTAKMEAIFKAYMGEKNARELVEKGVKASALRKYFSKGLGRFFGEQTTNLGLLFERLFKGFEAGGVVQDAMGLTDLINGKSQAQNETNRIINDYVNEFYKKKANNEAFNTELNNVERGMAAFMMRNVIGTAAEIRAEFNRRKNLIKESIEELANGNEKEVAKSLIYQDVYDKILKGANTVDDVVSKVDGVNLDAVKFWQNQWQGKYDELSDVSVNVYNKILEKDTDYTPDKYGKLSTSSAAAEITENDMAFHTNNGTLYKKETGVLMEATRPNSLPVDNTTGEVDRYIDLSFDSNNANSMYDALVDIKTAGPIRQVQAFLNSKSFKKIFPNAEDAAILKGDAKNKRVGRIELFTRNFRNKNPYSEDEFSNAVRNLNRLANVGVSQALGGIFQPIKQVIPAGINTLINGGSLDIDAMTNPDKIKFMMDSGYAIGFRGVESQAQVESLNRLMDMAAKSKGEAAIKYIEEANKIWLRVFLVKPDVFIARASWMTYYEQSLKKDGIDTNGIDYSTHKLNEKAANYAQRMVDRQQNVSDADLSGKIFSEKNPGKQVMMKVFMPFASFRMNQSARLGADIATITSKVSTQEDRKIAARSLAGFGVEMVTFRALSLGISLLTASVVAQMMGSEEEDEEKKKKSIMKGQATNTVSDILSPIPFTDPIIQAIAATTLQSAQDIAGVDEEEMISLFSPQDKGYLEQIGLFGFAAQRIVQTGELIWMSTVGHYRDDFGKKKYVSEEDKEALRLLIGPALLTNMGLAPSEMNSVVRASMSAAKKNSSTKEGGGTSGKDYESQMLDIMEEDLLEGYENKTDLKRYNPRLYEQNFGEGSEYYELTKEKREEQKKLDEEKQKEKDAEYGYKGKGKGFGSRSKSSGKGFGAKKFGKD